MRMGVTLTGHLAWSPRRTCFARSPSSHYSQLHSVAEIDVEQSGTEVLHVGKNVQS